MISHFPINLIHNFVVVNLPYVNIATNFPRNLLEPYYVNRWTTLITNNLHSPETAAYLTHQTRLTIDGIKLIK